MPDMKDDLTPISSQEVYLVFRDEFTNCTVAACNTSNHTYTRNCLRDRGHAGMHASFGRDTNVTWL